MIKVRNKILLIPESELSIAAAGDANSVTREFHIDRLQPDGIDLANLHFRLDIRYTDTDTLDHALLSPTVTDDMIVLIWTIQKDNSAHPGSMFVNIRAFNDDGLVRWSSFRGAFYVEQTVGGGEASSSQLSELEELEKRYDETAKKLSADMASLKNMERTATSYAVGGVLNDDGSPFREGQDEDNAKYYAEKSAESAAASAGSAEASAGSATESAGHAAESLRHAEDSARSAENSALSASGAKEFAGNAAGSATESAGHASKSEAAAARSSASAAASADSAAAAKASHEAADNAAARSVESAAQASSSASASASAATESKKYAEASRASADESASSAKASKNSEIAAAASEKTAVAAATKAETLINTSGLACLYIDENGILTLEATNDTLVDFRIVDNKDLEVTYG